MNYDAQTLMDATIRDAIDMEDDPQARAALRAALRDLENKEE